jgi:hypothetical protein
MTPLDELTFEHTGRQRRGLMIGGGVCVGLAAVFGVLAGLSGGRAVVGAITFGLASLVFIGYFFLAGRDFTTCDENGMRCRILGKNRAWSWSEVEGVDVQTYAKRGIPRSIIFVALKNGSRVGLTVPIHGGATKDPAFAEKANQIQECWRRNSGAVAP